MLGVDLGSRRIGLALSDPLRITAAPHAVIERTGDRATDDRSIVAAARAAEADRIIVGLPLSLSGDTGPAARAVLTEVDVLREHAGDITVDVYDERLTTVIAQDSLIAAKMRRDARRRVVDKVAAAVMLQSWLDRERATTND